MSYWRIQVAFGPDGYSPWDALWYDGDDRDLEPLCSQMRLAPVWRPLQVRLERREKRPDIFGFQLFFAVKEKVRTLLSQIEDVEFLPVRASRKTVLYVIHPLARINLDYASSCDPEELSDNITKVAQWVFPYEVRESGVDVFQAYQAPGSAARDAGYPLYEVFISERVKQQLEDEKTSGIAFLPVSFSPPKRMKRRR